MLQSGAAYQNLLWKPLSPPPRGAANPQPMTTDTADPSDSDDPFDRIVDAPFDEAISERYLVYALSTAIMRPRCAIPKRG
mgnify:CR=1 FL=1